MKEVEIMISSLKNHPYAQCYVSIDPNVGIHFYSYKTLVIYIDKSGWLRCTGTYSPTTRRQIGWFLREYAPMISYQMVKQCVIDCAEINIETGEIILPLV